MSGETIYRYAGNEKDPIDETKIKSFIHDAREFINAYKPSQANFHSPLADMIGNGTGRWNIDAMRDVETTAQRILDKLERSANRDTKKIEELKGQVALIKQGAYKRINNY